MTMCSPSGSRLHLHTKRKHEPIAMKEIHMQHEDHRPARRTAAERAAARPDPEAKYNDHLRKTIARRRAQAAKPIVGASPAWLSPIPTWRTASVPRDSALRVAIYS
jgi:hypothetical protein